MKTEEPVAASARARCLVADDHPPILTVVCDRLAEEGFELVGCARNGRDALDQIASLEPDIAIVDLAMPDLTGIEVTREAARISPATAVILYTGSREQALLVDAVDAGARGFVLKEAPLVDLVRAVETALAGEIYIDPVIGGTLAGARATRKLAVLTQRERDVLRLLADGKNYEQIGAELFIAPDTVRTHVQKAMRRLDANTRTQAVATALRQRLIG